MHHFYSLGRTEVSWVNSLMHWSLHSVSGLPHCSNSQFTRFCISAVFRPLGSEVGMQVGMIWGKHRKVIKLTSECTSVCIPQVVLISCHSNQVSNQRNFFITEYCTWHLSLGQYKKLLLQHFHLQ